MLHHNLKNKYSWYSNWHEKSHHCHLHWLTFALAALIATVAIFSAWQTGVDEHHRLVLNLNQVQAQTVCHPEDYSTTNLGDGHERTSDQAQIQRAINDCANQGGGEVVLQDGKTYRLGTIDLDNNITLNLNHATLEAMNEEKYFLSIKRDCPECHKVWITINSKNNVEILGPGLIRKVAGAGDLDVTVIEFMSCSDVTVRGTSSNSSDYLKIDTTQSDPETMGWHLNVASNGALLENFSIHGRRRRDGSHLGNDSLDITGSQNITVKNCVVNSADDGIVFHTGQGKTNTNALVENCTVSSDTSNLKFGTGSSGVASDITFKDITVKDSPAPAIRLCNLDGGTYKNITYDHIIVESDVETLFGCGAGSGWSGDRICDNQGNTTHLSNCDRKDCVYVREPECMDEEDNDNDGLVDGQDPDCHTDNNADNCSSYNPENDDDEAGSTPIEESSKLGKIEDIVFKNLEVHTDHGSISCGEASLNNISRVTLKDSSFTGSGKITTFRDICGLSISNITDGSGNPLDAHDVFDIQSSVTNYVEDGSDPVCNGSSSSSPYCGDNTCDSNETCSSCEADCGTCSSPPPANDEADIDCDTKVNIYDFGILMSCWENAYDETDPKACYLDANVPDDCAASPDITQDGTVDVDDLGILLSNWTG